MHKLAFDVEEMNEEQQKAAYTDGKAFSMIVHMKGTERSYQIEVAPPEGKSYASEIAQKYGAVSYTHLDVYKRQILHSAGSVGGRSDNCCTCENKGKGH